MRKEASRSPPASLRLCGSPAGLLSCVIKPGNALDVREGGRKGRSAWAASMKEAAAARRAQHQ